MTFRNPILGAGGSTLLRPAIQSPNYVTGSTGWAVKRDGSAEFNNLLVRGTFNGNDFIINSSGIFLYSGTPAHGNLVGSWAAAAGTDVFGNAYLVGLNVYSALGGNVQIDPSDAVLASLSPNQNLVVINDGQLTISGPGDYNNAMIIQNIRGALGTLYLESGKHVSTDVSAYLALITEAVGNDPVVQFGRSSNNSQASLVNGTVDVGRGVQSQVSISANVSGLTTTETVLMTIPSMTYQSGRAYRVTLWGLANSTTASTYFLYKLRKGAASTAGTVYKDQMRVPVLSTASTNSAVSLVVTLVNNSGTDITTAVTWTASCAAGTGVFAASAANMATATVEDIGLASQWPGQPIT